jgi:hypothetical protein
MMAFDAAGGHLCDHAMPVHNPTGSQASQLPPLPSLLLLLL